jgi:hypothetical protein
MAAASAPVPLLTDAEPPHGYNLRPDSPLSQYKSPDESDNAQLKSKTLRVALHAAPNVTAWILTALGAGQILSVGGLHQWKKTRVQSFGSRER